MSLDNGAAVGDTCQQDDETEVAANNNSSSRVQPCCRGFTPYSLRAPSTRNGMYGPAVLGELGRFGMPKGTHRPQG